MQQTVRLLDSLGERYGEEHTYQNLRSPADAIKLLCINRPAFEKELLEAHNNGVYYRVVQSGADMSYKDLQLPLGSKDLYIVPVIGGSGGGATTKILIGVGLVAASFLLPGAGLFGATGLFGAGSAVVAGTAGATATGVALTTLGTALSAAGAGMILGGIADVISPQPKLPSLGSARMASGSAEVSRGVGPQNFTRAMDGGQSYAYTGGSENSVGIGATVPVAFGKVLIGSHLLSIDTEVKDESAALRTSVIKPGKESITVNGKKLTNQFEVAGGVRSRTWLQGNLDKSDMKTNNVGEKVRHATDGNAKSITLRNSSTGQKELNSLTLTNTSYLRKERNRKNFMIFFELGRGLFDRVGDQPGSTMIPGFITYKITCTADNYKDEPVIAEIQATVQGVLPMASASNDMKYRWCHALAFPRLVDPDDAEVRVKITIVDHDTHKRPTNFDQMDLKVRFTGYNLFNKDSQNRTQGLIGL
jgi:predicted phage tail protein